MSEQEVRAFMLTNWHQCHLPSPKKNLLRYGFVVAALVILHVIFLLHQLHLISLIIIVYVRFLALTLFLLVCPYGNV